MSGDSSGGLLLVPIPQHPVVMLVGHQTCNNLCRHGAQQRVQTGCCTAGAAAGAAMVAAAGAAAGAACCCAADAAAGAAAGVTCCCAAGAAAGAAACATVCAAAAAVKGGGPCQVGRHFLARSGLKLRHVLRCSVLDQPRQCVCSSSQELGPAPPRLPARDHCMPCCRPASALLLDRCEQSRSTGKPPAASRPRALY